ncbi:MAG: hypothetical protein HFJ59_00890 [Clostridia bacterium]|nr:hypothetical protein [Clostridia bacterium]
MEKNRKVSKTSKLSLHTRIMIILIMTLSIILLNNIFVKATDEIVISKDNWSEWQDENYWEWHTRTTTDDKAYNGKHIIIQNDVIDFYGYGQDSYKDFLFKEYKNKGKKIFKFIIDESKANYHTLDGAGFIFNADIKDQKISGYILLFGKDTTCIYKIENIDINEFKNTKSTTVASFGELIKSIDKTNKQIHELSVEVSPTNVKIEEEDEEILNINLDYSFHKGESFGLISSYVQHDCTILSTIEFSQFKMILEDYNFKVLNTDLEENPILGAQFVLKDENGKVIKSGKSDNKGIFNVGNLEEGKYTIQQTVEPSGYKLNDNVYIFRVTADGRVINDKGEEIRLIIKNEPLEQNEKDNNYDSEQDNSQKDNTQENNNEDMINKEVNENKQVITPKQKDTSISKTVLPYAGATTTVIKIVLIISIITSIGLLLKARKNKR